MTGLLSARAGVFDALSERRRPAARKNSSGDACRAFLIAVVFAVTLCANLPALACGYHDPATIRVGLLNLAYPNALHVNGAIWGAQRAGKLPGVDTRRLRASGTQRRFLDSVAYTRSSAAIHGLAASIAEALSPGQNERFSLVLVETAMWTRFQVGPEEREVDIDTDGPGDGELVIVTGEAVLLAMRAGNLSISDANASGMMRLYRNRSYVEPAQHDRFVTAYGMLGSKPLPKMPATLLAERFGNRGNLQKTSPGHSAPVSMAPGLRGARVVATPTVRPSSTGQVEPLQRLP